MNVLDNLVNVFDRNDNEIHVDVDLARRAMIPLQRMLDFKK